MSASPREAMPQFGTAQLLGAARRARANTLRIAEEIPEASYDYRATADTRSVAETLVHIAWLASADRLMHGQLRLDTLEGFDFPALIADSRREERQVRSKEQILELLRTEGEGWTAWVEQLSDAVLAEPVGMPGGGSMSRFEMLLGTSEHELQHAAQLLVLQRLIGMVPHATRAMQGAA
jgi:uncharacterized damage-inducible protein DinB